MSYYEVKMWWWENNDITEPVDVFDLKCRDLVLLNPVVTGDVSEAGSFEFIVPKNHVYYDKFRAFESSIAVFEDGNCIFFGRLLPPRIVLNGAKQFHAEGALAFLNDVILPPMNAYELVYNLDPSEVPEGYTLDSIPVGELMLAVFEYYNRKQAREDRKLILSDDYMPSTEKVIYDPDDPSFKPVMDYVRSSIYPYCLGYFYTVYNGPDEIELRWRSDLTDRSSQPVTLGVNLLDMSQEGQTFYTAAIAKGGVDIGDGSDVVMYNPVVNKAAVKRYGHICAYLEFPEVRLNSITEDAGLPRVCRDFLNRQQFNGYTFEASAADMHPLNKQYGQLKLGQLVDITAKELGISVRLPIIRIVTNLTSAVKHVTIGSMDQGDPRTSYRKRTVVPLTKVVGDIPIVTVKPQELKPIKVEVKRKSGSSITGDDGNEYDLGVTTDPETGEPVVTATKVPIRIEFYKTKKSYLVGDTFLLSDFAVRAVYGDKTTEDITDKCTYNFPDNTELKEEHEGRQTLVATYTIGGVPNDGEENTEGNDGV